MLNYSSTKRMISYLSEACSKHVCKSFVLAKLIQRQLQRRIKHYYATAQISDTFPKSTCNKKQSLLAKLDQSKNKSHRQNSRYYFVHNSWIDCVLSMRCPWILFRLSMERLRIHNGWSLSNPWIHGWAGHEPWKTHYSLTLQQLEQQLEKLLDGPTRPRVPDCPWGQYFLTFWMPSMALNERTAPNRRHVDAGSAKQKQTKITNYS